MMICRGCNIEFTTKRIGQLYHDRNCFLSSSVKSLTCPECGKKFNKTFSKQLCCSKQCAYKYRAKNQTKGIWVNCMECNKPIYRMASKLKKYNFCCHEHRAAYQRSDKNKDFGKGWKHTPEEINKIRLANLNRDYDIVFTKETREKLAKGARNKIWTEEARENARQSHLGKILPEKQKQKIREHAKYGNDNVMWGGDSVTNQAMHMWVIRHKGKATKCVDEGSSGSPCQGRFEWSNVDHKYRRILEDYSERCTRHHRNYDLIHGLTDPKGKNKRFFAKAGAFKRRAITIDGIINEFPKPNLNYL